MCFDPLLSCGLICNGAVVNDNTEHSIIDYLTFSVFTRLQPSGIYGPLNSPMTANCRVN